MIAQPKIVTEIQQRGLGLTTPRDSGLMGTISRFVSGLVGPEVRLVLPIRFLLLA